MHIVYLNPRGRMGGAEAVLLETLKSISEAEPAWKLSLIVSEAGSLVDKASSLNVPTTVLHFPEAVARLGDSTLVGPVHTRIGQRGLLKQLVFSSAGIRDYVLRLRKELRKLAPDVIHTNGFKMHILGALAKPRDARLIWHVHDYVGSRPVMAKLMKLFQRRCHLALANSNSVAEDLKAVCGASLRVETLYNSIDTDEFSPSGEHLDLDSTSGMSPAGNGVVRIGMLGTLARWKGHEVFLRALSLLPRSLPVRGYILGDALYQTDGSQYSLAELNVLAERLGISERVGFTGFVDRPAAAMRALDIVVHASTAPEPFGLVIAEGMACGRPVVVSKAGGAAEIIHTNGHENSSPESKTGIALSYHPGNVEELAECIVKLVSDPALRARLGAAGRDSIQQRFNRKQMTQQLVSSYLNVAAKQSPNTDN